MLFTHEKMFVSQWSSKIGKYRAVLIEKRRLRETNRDFQRKSPENYNSIYAKLTFDLCTVF